MNKCFFNNLLLIWLSILLTVVSASGQGVPPDRRAHVRAAFEEFHSLLYFLSGNDRFLSQLSAEEYAQFEALGKLIIQRGFRVGAAATPAADSSSSRLSFGLRFSDNPRDFELKPGQPPRTAKVDNDVWFNLAVINEPQAKFNLLDTFQILFHEFGHKLGEAKNQEVIDRVAAKMRNYIQVFYRETTLGPGAKASSFVLPYLMFNFNQRIDFQLEPILLLDFEGHAAQLKTDVPLISTMGQSIISSRADLQNYTRVNLSPAFHNQEDGLLIQWNIERKEFLVKAEQVSEKLFRYNYLDLYSNSSKTVSTQFIEPLTSNKRSYQKLKTQDFLKAFQGTPVKLTSFAESPDFYIPTAQQNWKQALKVVGSTDKEVFLTADIQRPGKLKEVTLLAQHKNDIYDFPGNIEKLEGENYRLRFRIPKNSSRTGGFFVLGLGLNAKERWGLQEALKLDPSLNTSSKALDRPLQTLVWNGKKWQNVDQISSEHLVTDQVKFKFIFPLTTADLSHINFTWTTEKHIMNKSEVSAKLFQEVRESIPQESLIQTREQGFLAVEVTSEKASILQADIPLQEGHVLRDTINRGLVNINFVDQNLSVYATGSRLTKNIFASAFQLVRNTKQVISCRKIF